MEAQEELFLEIEKRIKENIKEIRTVDLYNNQFIRSNGVGFEGRKENIPSYPCCFIEFQSHEFSDGLRGFQTVDTLITFHIGYWCEKDRDFTIFNIKNSIYRNFHKWTPSNCNGWNEFLRRDETIDYDHDNVNIMKIEFKTSLSDFTVDKLGKPRIMNVVLNEVVTFTQSQINF
jgi:hypothetical protein